MSSPGPKQLPRMQHWEPTMPRARYTPRSPVLRGPAGVSAGWRVSAWAPGFLQVHSRGHILRDNTWLSHAWVTPLARTRASQAVHCLEPWWTGASEHPSLSAGIRTGREPNWGKRY